MSKQRNTAGARGPSQRQLRVGELVRHALSEILLRGDFPEPAMREQSLTVSEVRMSPDLRNATCFVMPLGGGEEERNEAILAVLAEMAPVLGHEVGRRVKLRFTPRLSFRNDDSFDEALRIDRLLNKPRVAADLENGE